MEVIYLGLAIPAAVAIFIVSRTLYLIIQILSSSCHLEKHASLRTILCIGSGGHTTEMLRLSKKLDLQKYQDRLYIVADNDTSSEIRVHKSIEKGTNYTISKIPRSRNVRQSYITSVFSTLYATLHTVPIVYTFKPDVIFCNGPGTCIPICIVAFVLRCMFLLDCRIVFVESICRVRTLSLSGKILQYFADVMVVQWPSLRDVCPRAKYFGRLT
ncbi:UDP-N-acetylglucosamine transferase subunit ALG14 homolog [Cydia pomonella]|uniref:UDP-N-acetylglucosamine transferase subunit ALG14 homolog n=1 Tax=Cydia pomonella TaxID=82600 RepID=UPI002ADDB468|nr:UDP-N-acetylglucosamine transferase subunit ALG14 homolog [Cydia pomonella]